MTKTVYAPPAAPEPDEAREWTGTDALIMEAFIACSRLGQTMLEQGVSRPERRRMMRFVSSGYLNVPQEVNDGSIQES